MFTTIAKQTNSVPQSRALFGPNEVPQSTRTNERLPMRPAPASPRDSLLMLLLRALGAFPV
jgi:hypothetical protein